MKKFFKKIAFVSALAMVISGMPAQTAKAEDEINMYPTLKIYLGRGEGEDFSSVGRYAKVWGHKDAGYTVKFASDNTDVAEVTENKGLVTAKKAGKANVTATFSKEGAEDVVKTCVVTVKNNAVEAGISAASEAAIADLTVGNTFTCKTYRTDANGVTSWKGQDVITDSARFTSSDPKVFTVTKKGGYIKAIGEGTATLSVWAVQSEGATRDAEGNVVEYKATTPVKTYTVNVKNPTVVFDRATLTAEKNVVDADGKDGTIITFTLYEKAGLIDTTSKDVQVRLSTTRGTLGFTNVTLENGRAQVLFTSPILATEQVAKIEATIISAGADDQELVNIQAAPIEIVCKPVVGKDDMSNISGARVLSTTVETADRIILKFNKDVTATDFMWLHNGNYVMTENNAGANYKFTLQVDDNIPQIQTNMQVADKNRTHVVNVLQYGPNGIALVLAEGQHMTDNSRYAVNFIDGRYNIAVPTSDVIGYVTDAFEPAVMSVAQYQNSLTQVAITLTEPIPTAELVASKVLIDGIPLLGFNKWGTTAGAGADATVTRLGSVENTSRNVYIVTLGKDAAGKQIYFKAGTHSLTVQNVGDYASFTDPSNKIATSTLDFYINGNTTAPDYTVTVQSPEQYIVDYNCIVDAPTTGELKLQYWNTTNNAWQDLNTLGDGSQTIFVQDITPVGAAASKVIIETSKDWTKVLAGTNTNYYNYRFRLYMAKDKIFNVANGLWNAEKADKELLDAKMKTVDNVCPEILSIKEKTITNTTYTFDVTLSEPVQVDAGAGNNYKGNTLTPSLMQGASIPVVTAQVVEAGLGKTYAATITGTNATDTVITVQTVALEAGKTYTIYLRSVSDDIGNTSNTLSIDFTVAGAATPAATKFQIAGVWADMQYTAAEADGAGVYTLDAAQGAVGVDLYDAVYVEFTTPISTFGGVKSVLTNTNWTINGYALPQGSFIIGQLIGESRAYGVTILLPNGTLTNVNSTIVVLSTEVEDASGQKINGVTQIKTQFPYTFTDKADTVAKFGWDGASKVKLADTYIGRLGRFAAATNGAVTLGTTNIGTKKLTVTLANMNNVNVKEVKVTVTDNAGKTDTWTDTLDNVSGTEHEYTALSAGLTADKIKVTVEVIGQNGCINAVFNK